MFHFVCTEYVFIYNVCISLYIMYYIQGNSTKIIYWKDHSIIWSTTSGLNCDIAYKKLK